MFYFSSRLPQGTTLDSLITLNRVQQIYIFLVKLLNITNDNFNNVKWQLFTTGDETVQNQQNKMLRLSLDINNTYA